jgi:hypothetical protein
VQAPCGKISRLDKKRAANQKTLNLRTDNIYDIVRFLFFGKLFLIAAKQFGHRKEDYILFHIINSMDMPTYVGILLIMFVLSIYSIVKYRKIKEPWKVLIYLAPPEFIVFITNRIIKEYWSNTHLYNISSTVALITGGIVMTSIFVVGIITKVKEKR